MRADATGDGVRNNVEKIRDQIQEVPTMRVLQINALGRTLSNGRTTREMHDYFLENGIESYIATARNADCDDAYAISTLDASHIHTALSMVTGLRERKNTTGRWKRKRPWNVL